MFLLYNRKDISGDYYIEDYYSQVVETHVLVLSMIISLLKITCICDVLELQQKQRVTAISSNSLSHSKYEKRLI
jgi:hypothetical protein